MRACAKHVFTQQDIDFTTEPEAAFSYLMTIEQDEETFKKYKHLILMDGGDGTFDYLYVKRFNDIWSKQDGDAFNNAGTALYKIFKEKMLVVFKVLDFNRLKMINAWYDAFKKQTALKLVDDKFDLKFKEIKEFYSNCSSDYCKEIVQCLIEEAKEQRIFEINRSEEDLRKDFSEMEPLKILQRVNLTVKPEIIKQIVHPIDSFCENFMTFYQRANRMITDKGEVGESTLIVFVGGLAANKTILNRIQGIVSELKHEFSSALEP